MHELSEGLNVIWSWAIMPSGKLKLLRLTLYLGFFIGVAVVLFGLGAVVASERRRRIEARCGS